MILGSLRARAPAAFRETEIRSIGYAPNRSALGLEPSSSRGNGGTSIARMLAFAAIGTQITVHSAARDGDPGGLELLGCEQGRLAFRLAHCGPYASRCG